MQTGFFSLGLAISLGEEKVWIQISCTPLKNWLNVASCNTLSFLWHKNSSHMYLWFSFRWSNTSQLNFWHATMSQKHILSLLQASLNLSKECPSHLGSVVTYPLRMTLGNIFLPMYYMWLSYWNHYWLNNV